jgi:general stress protein 26
MNTASPTERTLDDLLEGQRFAMLATAADRRITARPLTLLEQDGTTLRFLVSRATEWAGDLTTSGPVLASFADPGSNTYVSLTGTGQLVFGEGLVERLWNPAAAVYFKGPDYPDVAVLEVEVESGEWWEGPSSKVGQVVSMVRAKLAGTDLGDRGEVAT